MLSLLLALALICVPALVVAPYTILPLEETNETLDTALVNGENNYGYLKIQSAQYKMNNKDVDIFVTYEIETWLAFLVCLFGMDDLKSRVLGALQYPESGCNQAIAFQYLDTGRAVLHVTNATLDNQDNSYWFRAKTFGCIIPVLRFIVSDTEVKSFTNVKEMPKGIGYFKS